MSEPKARRKGDVLSPWTCCCLQSAVLAGSLFFPLCFCDGRGRGTDATCSVNGREALGEQRFRRADADAVRAAEVSRLRKPLQAAAVLLSRGGLRVGTALQGAALRLPRAEWRVETGQCVCEYALCGQKLFRDVHTLAFRPAKPFPSRSLTLTTGGN